MSDISVEVGIIFFLQTGVGIMGNSLLLCLYGFTLLTGQKMRPTDPILNQLVVANNLVLFFRGIPETMSAFGWKDFLGDAECQLVLYLHRVARGVSLNTTCLLSGFQATKLCPRFCYCKQLCKRCPKCVGVCGFYFWILQLLLNMYIPMGVTGPRGSQNISMNTNYRYCSSPIPKKYIVLLNAVLYFAIDAICLVFMILAGGSMVLVLYNHKQQVQHIRSHSLSLRLGPEDRATHTILSLVTMFVFFFGLSSISTLSVALTRNPNKRLIDAAAFLAACFPAFSPFLLISCDTRVSHIFDMCCRKKSLS
ncbi:vomeronasal type-1 receptor 1-like [Mesocricetus auratus]|uniref:Vomeronasal type-1 receptor n=1 Tax=Mesocricetus auratus TaxID=10036 RepID=A0ABM2WG20_MESAU|nr:vomeronasal type-1 receptor 1-like [Mesocricetus auratus]